MAEIGPLQQEYELVAVTSLEPHPENVNQGDLAAVTASIRANRFFGAVLAQRSTGRILVGKHRWLGAKECGLAAIPTIWVDCTDQEARRIMLADNRTSRLGADAPVLLGELLQRIASDTGTLEGTGYDEDFLNELLSGLAEEEVVLGDESKPSSTGSVLTAKLAIPPRAWLTMKAEITEAIEAAGEEYGLTVTWPE